MKKISYIIILMVSVLFAACNDNTSSMPAKIKMDLSDVTVTKQEDNSVIITAKFSYPTAITGMQLGIGKDEGLTDVTMYPTTYENEVITAVIADLSDYHYGDTYYAFGQFNNGLCDIKTNPSGVVLKE